VRYAIVEMEGRRVLLPIGSLGYDDTRRRITATGYNRERLLALRPYEANGWSEATERDYYQDFNPGWQASQQLDYSTPAFRGELPRRIQLLEEQLRVGKRSTQSGEVTLSKRPVTETVEQDITLSTERVEIERHAVNRPVEGTATFAAETERVVVPLFKEEAMVEKKPFVREEIEINKVKDTRTETIREDVRHEELVTEGLQERELSFAGTEPTEAELLERERLERERRDRGLL
jgi:uncharacterized protein (TIGR02271 family)